MEHTLALLGTVTILSNYSNLVTSSLGLRETTTCYSIGTLLCLLVDLKGYAYGENVISSALD